MKLKKLPFLYDYKHKYQICYHFQIININLKFSFIFFSIQVFKGRASEDAIDLVSKLLEYNPAARINPLQACAHSFFNELRQEGTVMPNGKELPPLFNFTEYGNFSFF